MPDRPSPRSPLRSVGLFVALLVIGVVAIVAGVPATPVVLVLSGVGGALLIDAQAARRRERVAELHPGALDAYPLHYPAERWPVGPSWQLRLIPKTRRSWAPGVLGVGFDEVRFVPSSAAKADLAWTGRPASVHVEKVLQASVVRVRTAAGDAAQFTIQQPADSLRAHLEPMLPLVADRPTGARGA